MTGITNKPTRDDEAVSARKNKRPFTDIDVKELERRFAALENDAKEQRKEFLTIFGIFASLVTFLAIEVQVFRKMDRYSLVAGISFFFLAALLMFSLSIRNIFQDKVEWSDFLRPVFVAICFFLAASMACFYWAIHTPK